MVAPEPRPWRRARPRPRLHAGLYLLQFRPARLGHAAPSRWRAGFRLAGEYRGLRRHRLRATSPPMLWPSFSARPTTALRSSRSAIGSTSSSARRPTPPPLESSEKSAAPASPTCATAPYWTRIGRAATASPASPTRAAPFPCLRRRLLRHRRHHRRLAPRPQEPLGRRRPRAGRERPRPPRGSRDGSEVRARPAMDRLRDGAPRSA